MGAFIGGIGQVAGIFGQIAGGFMQAQGQRQAAEAQARAMEAQAAAYNANAIIAEQNAASALRQGEASKSRQERIGKARLASSAVKYLKGGVVLAGSPLAVLGEEAINEALTAEDLLYESQIKATQHRNEAKMQRFYQQQSNMKAQNIREQADYRYGTSLLGSSLRIFS